MLDETRRSRQGQALNYGVGMIQGYQLDQTLSLRLIKSVPDNFILEHSGLPCVLPFAVHLDLGHLPDT